jgi:hypothetical protein
MLNPLLEKTLWKIALKLDELWALILEFQFILISGLVSTGTLSLLWIIGKVQSI